MKNVNFVRIAFPLGLYENIEVKHIFVETLNIIIFVVYVTQLLVVVIQ